MDKNEEKICMVCHSCQVTVKLRPTLTDFLYFTSYRSAWQDYSADLSESLPTGKSILAFARFGVPFSLRTDNGEKRRQIAEYPLIFANSAYDLVG